MYIEKINGPADVKRLSAGELETLSEEVRGVLLKKLSEHGGHVGPNLGMVEATVALHYVFNSPADKIVYDVSTKVMHTKYSQGARRHLWTLPHTMKCRATPNPRKANMTSSLSDIRRLPSALPPDLPKRAT